MEQSIEDLIYEETDKRLKEMADPDYQFPKRFSKIDYVLIIAMCCVCLALIIFCMTGVII